MEQNDITRCTTALCQALARIRAEIDAGCQQCAHERAALEAAIATERMRSGGPGEAAPLEKPQ